MDNDKISICWIFLFRSKNISNNKIIICCYYLSLPSCLHKNKNKLLSSIFLESSQTRSVSTFDSRTISRWNSIIGQVISRVWSQGMPPPYNNLVFSRVASCQPRPKQILSKLTLGSCLVQISMHGSIRLWINIRCQPLWSIPKGSCHANYLKTGILSNGKKISSTLNTTQSYVLHNLIGWKIFPLLFMFPFKIS